MLDPALDGEVPRLWGRTPAEHLADVRRWNVKLDREGLLRWAQEAVMEPYGRAHYEAIIALLQAEDDPIVNA